MSVFLTIFCDFLFFSSKMAVYWLALKLSQRRAVAAINLGYNLISSALIILMDFVFVFVFYFAALAVT